MAERKLDRQRIAWLEDHKVIDGLRGFLPPNKVLITGGAIHRLAHAEHLLASAEIFDPTSGVFTPVGEMTAARASHVAVALGQERVLVSGGLSVIGTSTRYVNGAEIFAGGTFRAISGMVATRAGHRATALYGGTVMLTGGVGRDPAEPDAFTLASGELLNPLCASEYRYEFVRTGTAMTWARNGHTLTALRRRPLALVAGGFPGFGTEALQSAELYDRQANAFLTLDGSMTVPRQGHGAALLNDGRVLIVGGASRNGGGGLHRSAELFDPASLTFAATGSLSTARERASVTVLRDGRVLVAGGFGANGAILRSAEIYDPASGAFSNAGSLGVGRVYHTATPLGDGRVLVAGGLSLSDDALSSAEIFNPDTGRFTPAASMSVGRLHHAATAL